MQTERQTRIVGFVGEYCPVCDMGHLNPIGTARDFVKCSICECELTIVGDELELVNDLRGDDTSKPKLSFEERMELHPEDWNEELQEWI